LTTGDIVDALLDAAFEVDTVTVRDNEKHAVFPRPTQTEDPTQESSDVGGWLHDARRRVRSFVSSSSFRSAKRRRHLDICEVCREEADEKSSQFSEVSFDKPERFASTGEQFTTASNPGITAFPATLPITTAPLMEAQNKALTEKGLSTDSRSSVAIELDPSKDRQTVPDIQSYPSTYEALFSIGGMTCGVCTRKVTETVEYFPWVKEARINLVSNSGLIVFESPEGGASRAAELLDEIESIGYDAHLEDLKCIDGPASTTYSLDERKLALHIDGLYCGDCAPKIVEALQTAFPDLLKIEQLPLLNDRILRVSYIPRPPQFTVRAIIAAISAIDQRYQPSVHRPPSLEERSIQILGEELQRYLRRLIVAVICAIPAFLLGIVWMSFVSSSNHIRQFLEQPMWVGSASRVEWALLFVSTPVMFYSANLFHTRAIREIIAQWRPGSAIPLSKRFYRFGSMNLLVSLGVTISYVASVAVLILAAATPAHRDTMAGVTTYFDSTVLLTMFLLMGKYT
jgi:Cu+-exporting ATPase